MEFAYPEQESCALNDYPTGMPEGSTVAFVNGYPLACWGDMCVFNSAGDLYGDLWEFFQNTMVHREYHSSVAMGNALLLIGGISSDETEIYTTELIPVDGTFSAAKPGPITVRHSSSHCTIKISADVIVLTGGFGHGTWDLVTEYKLSEGKETHLNSLAQPRRDHACGSYLDANDQQVSNFFCNTF